MIILRELQEVNADRAIEWHAASDGIWTGADWSNAMAGECGEACNVVKKIRRIETGIKQDPNGKIEDRLRSELATELADTLLYLLLVAEHYGIDVESAVIDKFNLVSEREGFSQRL